MFLWYDVTGQAPVQKQRIQFAGDVQRAGVGPGGTKFYVSGGVNDIVYPFQEGKRSIPNRRSVYRAEHGRALITHSRGRLMQQFGLHRLRWWRVWR